MYVKKQVSAEEYNKGFFLVSLLRKERMFFLSSEILHEQVLEIWEIDDILIAMERTKDMAIDIGFEENDILQLQLVAEEACTNSYEYVLQERAFPILFILKQDQNYIEIFIKQQGGNLSFENVDDSKTNYSLRGRGLSLIRTIMDECRVTKDEFLTIIYLKKVKQ